MGEKMINLTIDGVQLQVPEGTSVMSAAAGVGIEVPHLCFLKDINEISACKVCVVEVQGKSKLITACNSPVEEGMVVYTNSPKVRRVRKTNVELILSQHDCHCATCVRSRNCNLQQISNDLGILEVPFTEEVPETPWDHSFPLIRDSRKCIKCMRCVQICDKVQAMHVWDVQNTGSRTTVDVADNKTIDCSDCTLCGQCITHCPTGALRERDDTYKAFEALADPEKVTVVQVAPAVRTAWGEELGLNAEEASEGKMVAALKRIGFDYVFDTNFSADLTIMEEGSEFIERFTHRDAHTWPMFTSWCPGWVRFVKGQFPQFAKNLSTAKSPQQMFGAIAKSYFAEKIGVDPKNMRVISVMPCTSKKAEAELPTMRDACGDPDVDVVITTRELVRMLRCSMIDPSTLEESSFDSPLGTGTGAAVIFGATGGVMDAALRSAYYLVTGKNPDPDAFSSVRGMQGWKEASFEIPGAGKVRTAVVSGLGNTRKLLEALQSGSVQYDFVEIMACPGGCAGGGGQPIHDGEERADVLGNKLYAIDSNRPLHQSHNNPDVQELYKDFLEKPLSEKAEQLLHSDHVKEHNYM